MNEKVTKNAQDLWSVQISKTLSQHNKRAKMWSLKKNKPSQPNTYAKCTQLLNNNKKHYVKPLKPVSGPISDYENLTVL